MAPPGDHDIVLPPESGNGIHIFAGNAFIGSLPRLANDFFITHGLRKGHWTKQDAGNPACFHQVKVIVLVEMQSPK
jgi:hypothetical protein